MSAGERSNLFRLFISCLSSENLMKFEHLQICMYKIGTTVVKNSNKDLCFSLYWPLVFLRTVTKVWLSYSGVQYNSQKRLPFEVKRQCRMFEFEFLNSLMSTRMRTLIRNASIKIFSSKLNAFLGSLGS